MTYTNFRTPLTKATDNLSKGRSEMMHNLYESKKDGVTLDGKPALISRLGYKFTLVFLVGGDGGSIEFSTYATERILNNHCNFKS